MKRLLVGLIVSSVILTACSDNNNTTEIVNRYETSASKSIQWYEATPEDFLNDFNANLHSEIPQFEILTEFDSGISLSNNGETWKISIKNHFKSFSSSSKDSIGKISHIKLSLYSDSESDDIENGQLIRAFFNTLNPEQAEFLEDKMKIYKPDEQPSDVYEYYYGNTRYVYQNGNNKSLHAYPFAIYQEEETHTPIKPE